MDERIVVFMMVMTVLMFLASVAIIALIVKVGKLEDRAEINYVYLRDVDRDIDNLTEYVNNSKNALLDYFNLEIQKAPLTVKKKGK